MQRWKRPAYAEHAACVTDLNEERTDGRARQEVSYKDDPHEKIQ